MSGAQSTWIWVGSPHIFPACHQKGLQFSSRSHVLLPPPGQHLPNTCICQVGVPQWYIVQAHTPMPLLLLLDQSTLRPPSVPSAGVLHVCHFKRILRHPVTVTWLVAYSKKELCIWGCWHPALWSALGLLHSCLPLAVPPRDPQLAFTFICITAWSGEVFLALPQTWGYCAVPGV